MPPPSVKQQLKAAKAALDAHDYPLALSLTASLLSVDASNYHALVLRGVALSATHDTPAAVRSYLSAVALRPAPPLAHKGLIDALSPTDPDPAHRLALARAYLALPQPRWEEGGKLMYELATEDDALVEEAAEALRRVRKEGELQRVSGSWEENFAWMEVHLRMQHLVEAGEERREVLETGGLAEALDELESLLEEAAIAPADAVAGLVFERVVARCAAGDAEKGVAFLRRVGAYEAVLEVAEMGGVPAGEVLREAMRAVHVKVWGGGGGRARAVFAAELLEREGVEAAEKVVRLRVVQRGKGGGGEGLKSGTEAIVKAVLHLRRGEHKLAVEVAREGREVVKKGERRERQVSVLGLMLAAGLAGDRKYKEAVREYGQVRVEAQRWGGKWVEAAANRGMVEAAVTGHGRKSRQTSTAVEEAAGSAVSAYGMLECVWTDALADDIDCERMGELATGVVDKARERQEGGGFSWWEYRVLDPMFGTSEVELAAMALTRLGQMLLCQYGAGRETLARAQKCQMEAANLFKGVANPFAQLGYIFEKFAALDDDDKMRMRAMRCYEKAVRLDASHPLASRRLARMCIDQNLLGNAAEVAQQASDRNPKARWAHNIVGWYRVSMSKFVEASLSFRNALRGRPKLSTKAEEVLFGTDVGKTDEDNDLLLDVDSWRGFAVSYKGQGKIGPATACIEDALTLVRSPPLMYTIGVKIDVAGVQDSLIVLLEAERAMLLQMQRQTSVAIVDLQSVLGKLGAPLTVRSYLSEAYVDAAAELWVSGCYSRATKLRLLAAETLEYGVFELGREQPHLNPSNLFKRLGDTQMEISGHAPELLQQLVLPETIAKSVREALDSYCKAFHFSPWDRRARTEDLATALLRIGRLTSNESMARKAVELILATDCNPVVLTMAFMQLTSIESSENMIRIANRLGNRVSQLTISKDDLVALDASVAIHAAGATNSRGGAENAISAVRRDPSDWRSWSAVASVREADARRHDWPLEMIKSSEDAYSEADRLGAGPWAVHGIVRCVEQLLIRREQFELDSNRAYEEASYCLSVAGRAGLEEPRLCRQIVDAHRQRIDSAAEATTVEVSQAQTQAGVYKHLHMYPYLSEVRNLELLAS